MHFMQLNLSKPKAAANAATSFNAFEVKAQVTVHVQHRARCRSRYDPLLARHCMVLARASAFARVCVSTSASVCEAH